MTGKATSKAAIISSAWKNNRVSPKVFLATTALSEFWDKDQGILFLGPWCLQYRNRSQWENLKYKVMDNPWDDRGKFYKATSYLDDFNERLLGCLTDVLNKTHGVSYDKRYWRILIGPWLFHCVHVAYDRYVRLVEALRLFPELETIVLDERSYNVPADTEEFIRFVLDDRYNLQMFSYFLRKMGHDFPAKTYPDVVQKTPSVPLLDGVRRAQKNAAKRLLHFAGESLWKMRGDRSGVGLWALGCSRVQTWALARRSNWRAIPLESNAGWSFRLTGPLFDERRRGLQLLPASTEFERVFNQFLLFSFPILYLEHYHEARNETLRIRRKIPDVIVSAANWYADENFKFYAAEASAQGSRLVAVQLGGGYGIHRYTAAERHEHRVADSYFVWGWADKRARGVQNLPSLNLSRLAAAGKTWSTRNDNGSILFVATAHIRYLFRFHSFPVGIQNREYFQWQLRFLACLSHKIFRQLRFRTYPVDYGHATREQIADQYPMIQWDNGTSFHANLKDARLAVFDHSGTSFLEALVCNIPSILFWDPRWSEVRDEAKPYFEDLRRVGILWDSPEDAAKKVEAVYEDPWTWWNEKAVQEVRRRFVDRYAFAREDWVDYWVQALEEEIALAQVPEKSG